MDAVIVVGQPPAPGCVTEQLWSEPIIVAVSETNPIAAAAQVIWPDLNGARFLVSRIDAGPEIQDYIVQHLATLGHHPVIEPRMVGRDGLLALVGLEQGVTLVSGAEEAVSYPGVVLRPLVQDRLPFGLVWSELNDDPILRRFMSHARRWAAARQGAVPSVSVSGTPDLPP